MAVTQRSSARYRHWPFRCCIKPSAAARCSDAIGTLIRLRTIRHAIEHGDARAKAVAAYAELGLTFLLRAGPRHGRRSPRSPAARWTRYGRKSTPGYPAPEENRPEESGMIFGPRHDDGLHLKSPRPDFSFRC